MKELRLRLKFICFSVEWVYFRVGSGCLVRLSLFLGLDVGFSVSPVPSPPPLHTNSRAVRAVCKLLGANFMERS